MWMSVDVCEHVCASVYLWVLCVPMCSCVCVPWAHVGVRILCPHVCKCDHRCGAGLSGRVKWKGQGPTSGSPRESGGAPHLQGSQLGLCPPTPTHPGTIMGILSLCGFQEAWEVWGRAANLGCGAICQPSPFRSCGFLRVRGSCPLRPPLPVLVRPGGQDTPPTPRPHPQEAGLGGRRWGRCHSGCPAPREAVDPAAPRLRQSCQQLRGHRWTRRPSATTMFGRKRSVSFGGFGWWVTDGRAGEGVEGNLAVKPG